MADEGPHDLLTGGVDLLGLCKDAQEFAPQSRLARLSVDQVRLAAGHVQSVAQRKADVVDDKT